MLKLFILCVRSLFTNKKVLLINVIGLFSAYFISSVILIFIKYEKSYDQFLNNYNNLYRLTSGHYSENGKYIEERADCYYLAGEVLSERLPEIKKYVKFTKTNAEGIYSHGELVAKQSNALFSSEEFFNVFSFKLIQGNKNDVLKNPNSIVLSEKLSDYYFGKEDPLGKIIKFRGQVDLEVTGVFEEIPDNSHITADLIVSFNVLDDLTNSVFRLKGWSYVTFYTYLLARDNTELNELKGLVQSEHSKIIKGTVQEEDKSGIGVQKLSDIYLKSHLINEIKTNGSIKIIHLFILIIILIIIVAWINYTNLSVVRYLERKKEIGIKKVVGSSKRLLFLQFLFESFILQIFCMLCAILTVIALMPFISNFIQIPLSLRFELSEVFIVILLAILGSMIPSIYPSYILSKANVSLILKEKFQSRKGNLIQQILLVFQFSATIILIAFCLTILVQISYMRNSDLGFNKKDILIVEAPQIFENNRNENIISFKEELNRLSSIHNTSSGYFVPGEKIWLIWSYKKLEENMTQSREINTLFVDQYYTDILNLKILKGNDFKKFSHQNESLVILNKKAAGLFDADIEEIINQNLINHNNDTFRIVGVVDNFHHLSLEESIDPLVFIYNPFVLKHFMIKSTAEFDPVVLIKEVKDEFLDFFPGNPFDYDLLDDYYENQYKEEIQFMRIILVFTFFIVLISSIGLYGLTFLLTRHKTKEICIRKVFGTPRNKIIFLIYNRILMLLSISVLVALPIGYYISKGWLQNFAFKISIGLWFLLPILILLVVTIISVSSILYKAMNANPAELLRYE